MGLLSQGTPLSWAESRQYNDYVREHGINQLVNCFNAAKGRHNDHFFWGDEIEYHMIRIDDKAKTAQLSLNETEVLKNLGEHGKDKQRAIDQGILFHPEYGRFMLEATPYQPYDGETIEGYAEVEQNMSVRRSVAHNEMGDKNVHAATLTAFPTMGCDDFTYPKAVPKGPASQSLFLPDEVINQHVRFPTLTANIRRRRGQKVAINIPLFEDTNTDMTHLDSSIPKRELFSGDDEAFLGAAKPGHIYMDSMGFGMGCCCLQVTLQAPDINEARYIYDSFVNIAPALLALTAATPILKGRLADQDVRWNVISGAVDDRCPEERGEATLQGHKARGGIADNANVIYIPKSRYDSVDQYLGDIHSQPGIDGLSHITSVGTVSKESESSADYTYFEPSLNDVESPINPAVYAKLRSAGFDHRLARHFAHLYIRDPLVIFKEKIKQDDATETDHFENIQSTNWQTLRFKPPTQKATPGNDSVPGWRVEIRPMEISVTDFENAAFAAFSMLLARAVIKYRPNFYVPISVAEQNMKVAHTRRCTTDGKFGFRVNSWHGQNEKAVIAQLSLDQLFNGYEDFEGLVPVTRQYVHETFEIKTEQQRNALELLEIYFKFISKRALGEIPSTAKFIRSFVMHHPEYKHDSKINSSINYDLIKYLQRLERYDPELTSEFFGKEISTWMSDHGY